MEIYYDIVVKDGRTGCSISYWADTFSIDENRILKVKSSECGDINVFLDVNDRLSVRDVLVEDQFDEVFAEHTN